jgi:hypothetical protein
LRLLASFLLLFCTASVVVRSAWAAQPPPPAPAAQFSRGSLAFQRAEYARAIEILRPLLYPEVKLGSEGEIVQAHRMLGVAHLFMHQNELASEEFRKLLQLRPDFRMDALIDPPMVVDFFNGVLGEQEAEIAAMEKKRREAEARAQKRAMPGVPCPDPTVLDRRTIRNSRAVSFLPFGAGQFQNGQARKGWGFFGAETALGAISLGALATNFALYGVRPTLKCEPAEDQSMNATMGADGCPSGFKAGPDKSRSELLLKVQLISGTLFFATAIWGVTDAILNFQPEVVISTPVRNTGAAGPVSRRGTPSHLRVGPALFADGMGGSLAFRF